MLEKNGIENNRYMVITDIGIEKNKDFDLDADDLDKVKSRAK
ncbi:MAG: hypothetical protein GY737_13245 [Desulfobacteraceae bacterium]|nr:hypothetical protein [Desulfobacteraceae bacterium]